MVAEQLVCAIDQVDLHDRIIADAGEGPERGATAGATVVAGARAEDG
jgi:hypothetical protein